jgi:hypothetical protein
MTSSISWMWHRKQAIITWWIPAPERVEEPSSGTSCDWAFQVHAGIARSVAQRGGHLEKIIPPKSKRLGNKKITSLASELLTTITSGPMRRSKGCLTIFRDWLVVLNEGKQRLNEINCICCASWANNRLTDHSVKKKFEGRSHNYLLRRRPALMASPGSSIESVGTSSNKRLFLLSTASTTWRRAHCPNSMAPC